MLIVESYQISRFTALWRICTLAPYSIIRHGFRSDTEAWDHVDAMRASGVL